jgi:hypothetical protein
MYTINSHTLYIAVIFFFLSERLFIYRDRAFPPFLPKLPACKRGQAGRLFPPVGAIGDLSDFFGNFRPRIFTQDNMAIPGISSKQALWSHENQQSGKKTFWCNAKYSSRLRVVLKKDQKKTHKKLVYAEKGGTFAPAITA